MLRHWAISLVTGSEMQVVFDAYWWRRGPQSNRSVLRDLVPTWRAQYPGDNLTLAVPAGDVAEVEAEVGPGVAIIPLRLWPHGLAVAIELPFRLPRGAVAVTNNFTPWWGRSAVFIQDLLFVSNPEWFTFKERLYFSLMPFTAPRARVVLATSRDQAEVVRRVVRSARDVRAVGLGLSRDLLQARPRVPAIPLNMGSFILSVGRLNIRKNLARACLAAVRSGRLSRMCPLVVVGVANGRTTEFPDEVQIAIADGRVVLAGHIDTAELAWLYEHAGLFLFLSLGEGFGLPPVEALAFGARVLASDIPVMREVLNGHASFVDPTSVDNIARAIADAEIGTEDVMNRDLRRDYARRSFSWPTTVAAIRAAAGGGG